MAIPGPTSGLPLPFIFPGLLNPLLYQHQHEPLEEGLAPRQANSKKGVHAEVAPVFDGLRRVRA